MGINLPCGCNEQRVGRDGRSYFVCSCPIPADRKPSLRYGVKQSEWRRISRRVIARDNATCQYCGSTKPPMQCDHVVAFTRGGTNEDTNLVAACSDCNRSKSNNPIENWEARP